MPGVVWGECDYRLGAEYQEQAVAGQIYSGVHVAMSTGGWRIIVAVVGLIAILGLGAVSYNLYDASQQRESAYHYQPSGQAGLKYFVPRKSIPKGYKPHCYNPQTKEDSDLCAQWAAVAQVTEANRLSSLNLRFVLVSLWGTLIATVLLVWTLAETRNVARKQLRAYVTVESAGIESDPNNPGVYGVMYVIKNTGVTPAHHAQFISSMCFDEIEKIIPPVISDEAWKSASQGVIGPNCILHSVPFRGAVTPAMRDGIIAGTHAFFTFGEARYVDAFDNEHFLKLRHNLYFPANQIVLVAANEGNEST
jgi:hypothetical protein